MKNKLVSFWPLLRNPIIKFFYYTVCWKSRQFTWNAFNIFTNYPWTPIVFSKIKERIYNYSQCLIVTDRILEIKPGPDSSRCYCDRLECCRKTLKWVLFRIKTLRMFLPCFQNGVRLNLMPCVFDLTSLLSCTLVVYALARSQMSLKVPVLHLLLVKHFVILFL